VTVNWPALVKDLLLRASTHATHRFVELVALESPGQTDRMGYREIAARIHYSLNVARSAADEAVRKGFVVAVAEKNSFRYALSETYQNVIRPSDNETANQPVVSETVSENVSKSVSESDTLLSASRPVVSESDTTPENVSQNVSETVSPGDTFSAGDDSGTDVATRGRGFGTHEESIKPSSEEEPAAVDSAPRPKTKREVEREAAAKRQAERKRAREEREAAKARAKSEREAARAKKAEEKRRAADDWVNVSAEPIDVQIVYRKLREVLQCKTVAPSKDQQRDALALARELCAALEDGTVPTAADRCDQLDHFRVLWFAGAFHRPGDRIVKPYVGNIRSNFEASLAMPHPSSDLAHRAPERTRRDDAASRAADRLRAQTSYLTGEGDRRDSHEDEPRLSAPARR
jgi:hypothetical protein